MDIDVLWVRLLDVVEEAVDATLPAGPALPEEQRYAVAATVTDRIHEFLQIQVLTASQSAQDLCCLERWWAADVLGSAGGAPSPSVLPFDDLPWCQPGAGGAVPLPPTEEAS